MRSTRPGWCLFQYVKIVPAGVAKLILLYFLSFVSDYLILFFCTYSLTTYRFGTE